MKFSCDRCDAQYMISDEKVGPNGVKVRCKKCSNVILVRRAAENGAISAQVPAPAPATTPTGEGLEAELGHAFDNAFGDAQPKQDQQEPAAAPAPDADSTQAVSPDEAARLAARSAAPEPAATEWYVAIGQAQVGPLPLTEVRRKWEAGDVGPDSLVWRPGMGDWAPLKDVSDLAAYLAPVPRGPVRAKPSQTPAPGVGRAAAAAAQPAAQMARADVSWKPSGASALAALASEELSAQAMGGRVETRPAATAKSLVDALPDGGGVDPTGAIPLQIRALENTGEAPAPRSAVARGAERLRKKRSSTRALVATIVVLVIGMLGIGGYAFRDRVAALLGTAAVGPEVATAQPPAPAPESAAPAKPAAAATAPAPAPAVAVADAPTTSPSAATAAPSAPPAAPGAAPAPGAPALAVKEPAPAKADPVRSPPKARTERKHEPPARVERVARREDPSPEPAARPARKSNDVLDFDSGGDAALDEALGGKGSGRSVYVPPAPGGGSTIPERVTDSQVNETILTRVSALQGCLAENKSGSGVLKLRWSISPDGAVQNLRNVTPETANTPFAQCVTGVLRGLRFPKTQQGRTDVTFPFKF
jgi:predicted Zn finger-like uncharacterized protein